jgi:4-hydroxybenzoate polyprenyltransferase/geranylgeranylglycerol-phosphate geranylgeranyltransferase
MSVGSRLFAHLETMRPYTLFWCGLVSLSGAVLASQTLPSAAVLIFGVPILGWIAGLYLADYSDRKLDSIQKSHRPIPSGRITPWEALMVGGVFAFLGLVLTFFLGYTNVVLTFFAAGLVYVYARYSKPRGLWGNLTRGMLTFMTFLFGVAAVQPLTTLSLPLLGFAVVFFFHDTNSNIIGAMRDVRGDKAAGYQTTPVRYGMQKSLLLSLALSLMYLGLVLTLVVSFHLITFLFPYFVALAVGIILLTVMYVLLFAAHTDLSQTRMLYAHELFVAERILFAAAIIIGVLGLTWFTIILLLTCLVLTLLSQHLLRRRYELT